METSETGDSNASTVVDDLAHIDARAPLASPIITAPESDEDVNSNDDTMPLSSYGSDETFDWRTMDLTAQFSNDSEDEGGAVPRPIEDLEAVPWHSTPKRKNSDNEDEENSP